MASNQQLDDAPLTPYRALDLTEGGFNWCGKVLADMGADVIKVEPVAAPAPGSGAPSTRTTHIPKKPILVGLLRE